MQVEHTNRMHLFIKKDTLVLHLFGISLLSIFLPFKIYPVLFIFTSFLMLLRIDKKFYAACLFFFLFLLSAYFSTLYTKIDDDVITAITKLTISVILIISCSLFYYDKENSHRMLVILNKYLTLIIILSFIQVLWLNIQSGWSYVFASNSYDASKLFTSNTVYFGGDDKNMFGAKVALFGLLQYITSSMLRSRKTTIILIISFLAGALSLSRTPVAFLIGALVLYKVAMRKNFAMKIIASCILFASLILISPYILEYLRLDAILSGQRSDGMAIRIMYWASVINNIDIIGLNGLGILSAREFLPVYSIYYNGEPNVHNLYLNTFLDLGLVGISFYLCGFLGLYLLMRSINKQVAFVTISCAFVMSCTLYTAYDVEMWAFLTCSLFITRISGNQFYSH